MQRNMKLLTKILSIITFFLLVSCNSDIGKEVTGLNVIEIGSYQFDFPNDFKLVKEKGTDSYVGKIIGDGLTITFDYGYYSNSFAETPNEYLDKEHWKMEIIYQFLEEGVLYDDSNYPKVDILGIRSVSLNDSTFEKGIDFIATCKHSETTFEFPISLPNEIKKYEFKIDTLSGHFRKLVIANDPFDGLTGLYLKDLDSYNKSINSSLALSMSTLALTKKQQELVIKIFETVRVIKKNKTRTHNKNYI
jgi:hypothetical protein